MECKKKINLKQISIIILGLSIFFVFINPDKFMGIADYFYFYCLYILICIFSGLRIKANTINFVAFFVIFLIFFATVFAAVNNYYDSGYTLSYLLYSLVFLCIINMKYSEKDIRLLLKIYVFSAAFIALWIIIQNYDYYGSGNERHTLKFLNNDAFDPNFISAYLVFPFLVSLNYFVNGRLKLYLLFSFIIMAAILYTSSRGAFISSTLGGLVILMDIFKWKNKKIVIKRFVFLIIIAMLIGYFFFPINSLIRIFDFNTYKDGSNAKRLLDWKYGLDAFAKRPLFGYGIQGEMAIIESTLGVQYIAHNTFIGLLLQFGLIGLAIPVCFLLKFVLLNRKNKLLVATFLSTFIFSFLISAEVAMFVWIPIMIVMVKTNCTNEKFQKRCFYGKTINYCSSVQC